MECPKCGHQNAPQGTMDNRCDECGYPLISPEQKFNISLEKENGDPITSFFKAFWKIAFWLYAILLALVIFNEIWYVWGIVREDIISETIKVVILGNVLPILGLIGFYGYAYKRKIGGAILWKILLFALIIVKIYAGYRGYRIDISMPNFIFWISMRNFLFDIINPIFLIPMIALFLYGWHSRKIWKGGN